MATKILVKVYTDGTGDYTNLRAAVIAEAVDLVSIDSYIVFELKGDLRNTDPYVDLGSYTTDATRNIIIRPISADKTTGVAGGTGTVYGTNTYLIVARNEFVKMIDLEVDGWTSSPHSASNLSIENLLVHDGTIAAPGIASAVNIIAYNVGNNCFNGTDCTNVTSVSKTNTQVLFRNNGVLLKTIGLTNNSAGNTYFNTTDNANNNNASGDGSAPGASTYTVSQSDFVDYANNNFNISSSSSLFSLSIGANLTPVATGVTITATESYTDFSESIGVDVVPATNASSVITESYADFSELINTAVAANVQISTLITESYDSFTEGVVANIAVDIASAITESHEDFSETISVSVSKDIALAVTESYEYFTESITASFPIIITVNPKNIAQVKRKNNSVIIKRKSNIVRVR